jgi:nitroreductase
MELLTEAKEQQLLESSLDSLHEESMTWLKTILFWEDETKFYKTLLDGNLFTHTKVEDKNKIDSLLNHIIIDKLHSFKIEVLFHEKSLYKILNSNSDTYDFRQKHKLYTQKILELEGQTQQIKSGIFELYKLASINFFNTNETLYTIHERRAVRKYKKKSIDRTVIEKIIMAGKMAPTAMNQQLWKFYVLTDIEKIKLYSSTISKVAENSHHLSFKSPKKDEDSIFHGAPAVIFITVPKGNEWVAIDAGMCAQNIMLAAKSLGYDTCPVGLSKFIEQTEFYKDLAIPPAEEIKLAITLGYGDETPEIHQRKNNNITFLN